jgi:aspartyl-tRNA synthetase
MLLCGEKSIREVIAFPKTQKGVCLLTDSPAPVSEEQLEVLGITLRDTCNLKRG